TILGENFGPSLAINDVYLLLSNAQLVGLAATGIIATCNVTIADVESVCTTAAGVGFALQPSIRVAGQLSLPNSDTVYRYFTPVIDHVATFVDTLQTSGNEEVILTGSSFGPNNPENIVNAYYQNSILSGLG